MNSSELPTTSHPSPETSRWDDVRRIYRRVCLLRATGRNEEAAELQNAEFSHALAVARHASDAGIAEAEVLAEEAERVSSACILAELLAPLIAGQLRDGVAPASRVSAVVSRPADKPAPVEPLPRREASPAGVPGIADLIDGMLSQENAFSGGRAR